jgi:hypothetical protein
VESIQLVNRRFISDMKREVVESIQLTNSRLISQTRMNSQDMKQQVSNQPREAKEGTTNLQ